MNGYKNRSSAAAMPGSALFRMVLTPAVLGLGLISALAWQVPEPAPSQFRVAAIQFVSEFGNQDGNRERLERFVRRAAAGGAKVVVMPEAALPGYLSNDLQTAWRDPVRRPRASDGRSLEEAGIAETVPGPLTRRFGELSRELGIYLLITLIERVPTHTGADYFNSAVLLDPEGSIAAHYRKLNPWPIGEATWAQRGDRGVVTCDTPYGRLGILICYDFTCGVADQLKAAGATTLLYPIGWVCPNPEDWFDEMFPEKVKELGIAVIGANWALDIPPSGEFGWAGFGYSRIVAGDGTVLAKGQELGDAILFADLPVSLSPAFRRR